MVVSKKLATLVEGEKIIAINVKLSPASHVTETSLTEAYKLEVEGSRLEKIPLNIKKGEVELECRSCGNKLCVSKPIFSCPECKGADLQIKEIPEFVIESIEIEK